MTIIEKWRLTNDWTALLATTDTEVLAIHEDELGERRRVRRWPIASYHVARTLFVADAMLDLRCSAA